MEDASAENRKRRLAGEIMSLSAAHLLLDLRFMARAVNKLRPAPGGDSFACSGTMLHYSDDYVLSRYRQGERLLVHDHLHALLHCIFRHFKPASHLDRAAWNAAADIAVESVIIEAATGACTVEHLTEKQAEIRRLSADVGLLTAERLYKYFTSGGADEARLARLSELFSADDHKHWFRDPKREYEDEEKLDVLPIGLPDEKEEPSEDKPDDTSSGEGDQGEPKRSGEDRQPRPDGEPENDPSLEEWLSNERGKREQELEQQWRDIAEQLASELENFRKQAGSETKNLVAMIKDTDRDRCDYAAFLRRFAVTGEQLRVDPDCFDVNFYTYGLGLYGNAALIEPLEYRETRLVREFVVAIDTSGSVSGETVRSFVKKTFSLLRSSESFFSKVNIYIMQCDTEVREAVRITDSAELDRFISQMEIKGLGGTDFRPGFEYVDGLMKSGELRDLRGLVYFTDGYGEFPKEPPAYQTAFAFLRSDFPNAEPPGTPPWAARLILEEDDLRYG